MTQSYDYDAPVTEAGDMGAKYLPLKSVFSKYIPVPPGLPSPTSKGDYGNHTVASCANLWDAEARGVFETRELPTLMSMEELGQAYGYVQYTVALPKPLPPSGSNLTLTAMQDRALVYLNGRWAGLLGWSEPAAALSLRQSNTTISYLNSHRQ